MGVLWLGALCLVQFGVIVGLSGISIRFHRQQHASIKGLNEIVAHWVNEARELHDINVKLGSTAEEQRHENESAKRALEFFDEMRRALEKYDDGPVLF